MGYLWLVHIIVFRKRQRQGRMNTGVGEAPKILYSVVAYSQPAVQAL